MTIQDKVYELASAPQQREARVDVASGCDPIPRREFTYDPKTLHGQHPPWPEYVRRKDLVRGHVDAFYFELPADASAADRVRYYTGGAPKRDERFPVTLDLAVQHEQLVVDARMNLARFRRADRVLLYPQNAEKRSRQRPAEHAWSDSARQRGQMTFYLFPVILRDLATHIRFSLYRRPLPLREGSGVSRTPCAMFAPTGPWQSVPHAATDYVVQAQATFDLRTAQTSPIRMLEEVLAETWMIKPLRATVDYK